jgi:pimeloyl-ACP methyl ester carboxylesterase
MHGGWCWRDVRQHLSAAGHEVSAPTLTGQGERRQALTPEVGVATHVTDLTELAYFEDLSDGHLVLHSYAGVLAGPVAKRAAGRLASVTYLAAFITQPGQCLLDVEPPEVAQRYRERFWMASPGSAPDVRRRRSPSGSGPPPRRAHCDRTRRAS